MVVCGKIKVQTEEYRGNGCDHPRIAPQLCFDSFFYSRKKNEGTKTFIVPFVFLIRNCKLEKNNRWIYFFFFFTTAE